MLPSHPDPGRAPAAKSNFLSVKISNIYQLFLLAAAAAFVLGLFVLLSQWKKWGSVQMLLSAADAEWVASRWSSGNLLIDQRKPEGEPLDLWLWRTVMLASFLFDLVLICAARKWVCTRRAWLAFALFALVSSFSVVWASFYRYAPGFVRGGADYCSDIVLPTGYRWVPIYEIGRGEWRGLRFWDYVKMPFTAEFGSGLIILALLGLALALIAAWISESRRRAAPRNKPLPPAPGRAPPQIP